MSIRYEGKSNIEDKVNALLKEMREDENLMFTLYIEEHRKDEIIDYLNIKVISVDDRMPNF